MERLKMRFVIEAEKYNLPHLDEIQREQLEREKENEQRAKTESVQAMAR